MTQTPDQQLDDILMRFAQQVQEDYPALKDAFVLLDSRRWKMFQKFDISKFDGLTPEMFDAQMDRIFNRASSTKGSAATRIYYPPDHNKRGVGGVIIYGHARSPTDGIDSVQKPHGIYRVLYHELGHLTVKDAADEAYEKNKTYAESAADIYSLIRLHQDFGKAACLEQAECLIQKRTKFIVEGSYYSHFSVPAVRAFVKEIDQIDFNAFTPEHAGELARHFALTYNIPESTVEKLGTQLNEYWDYWQPENPQAPQQKLVEKACTSNDHLFVQTALVYLRHIINTEPSLLHDLIAHEMKLEKEQITAKNTPPSLPAARPLRSK